MQKNCFACLIWLVMERLASAVSPAHDNENELQTSEQHRMNTRWDRTVRLTDPNSSPHEPVSWIASLKQIKCNWKGIDKTWDIKNGFGAKCAVDNQN